MNRPLWQLLLLVNDAGATVDLSCVECFALLEYEADLLAAGADPAESAPVPATTWHSVRVVRPKLMIG